MGSEKPPQLAAGEKAIGDGSPPVCDAVRGIARRGRKKRRRTPARGHDDHSIQSDTLQPEESSVLCSPDVVQAHSQRLTHQVCTEDSSLSSTP